MSEMIRVHNFAKAEGNQRKRIVAIKRGRVLAFGEMIQRERASVRRSSAFGGNAHGGGTHGTICVDASCCYRVVATRLLRDEDRVALTLGGRRWAVARWRRAPLAQHVFFADTQF